MTIDPTTSGDIFLGSLISVMYLVQLLRKRWHPYAVGSWFMLFAADVTWDLSHDYFLSLCILAIAATLFVLNIIQKIKGGSQ